ncbi:hypothetical protein [Leptospira levettii]|uniref:hypothetical protein n=1 Tax=Leptospira levettii TaxID=2023178 RepID=UPI0011049210|nr:hypothetical protein [Leptospira levettii]TGL13463.1 hypothetical protein EHQ39_03640 [Leptospira levettii]
MHLVNSFQSKYNPTDSYTRFYFTKEYLKFKGKEFHCSKTKMRELGLKLGYNTENSSFLTKIKTRIDQFESCVGQIPYKYLDVIGVQERELNLCQELDFELFEKEKSKPRFPLRGFFRHAPCIYRSVSFPENSAEEQAIQYLVKDDLWKLYSSITYPELLIIIIPAGKKEPSYHWLEPAFEECKLWLDFGMVGYQNGVVRVG